MEGSIEPERLEKTQPLRRRAAHPKLSPRYVHQFVEQIVGEDFHAKRVLSLANGVVGVMHAAALAVHFIGEGLAIAEGAEGRFPIPDTPQPAQITARSASRAGGAHVTCGEADPYGAARAARLMAFGAAADPAQPA